MYKEDLALNNLQGLICHKTQLNQMGWVGNNWEVHCFTDFIIWLSHMSAIHLNCIELE